MESTQSSAHYFVETPLKAKIRKASASVPRHMQWRLYIASLVLVDILMLGVAFRLAYYLRFEISFRFFFQNLDPNLVFYQNVATFLIPILLVIFLVTFSASLPARHLRHARRLRPGDVRPDSGVTLNNTAGHPESG